MQTAVSPPTPAEIPPDALVEAGAAAGEARQFVSFSVGEEEYAIDIMRVREIKGWTEVTSLPNQPRHMRGVLNLRGVIVPIIDLRCRFGHGATEASKTHVVIIAAIASRVIGILVDAVSDILNVAPGDIRGVPEMDGRQHALLTGLVTAGERMVAILDLEQLISADDLTSSDAGAERRAVA